MIEQKNEIDPKGPCYINVYNGYIYNGYIYMCVCKMATHVYIYTGYIYIYYVGYTYTYI